jgi:hypothetical protein
MPYLVISLDVTRGRLRDAEHHDAELSAILQQAHSAMVMRAVPQELFDTERTIVGEVRYQERPPDGRGIPLPPPERRVPEQRGKKPKRANSAQEGRDSKTLTLDSIARLSYPPPVATYTKKRRRK